jgi:hypothetical protein
MKRIILSILCIVAITVVNAQLSFGGKAGLNLATITGDDVEDLKMKPGLYVGLQVQVPITESFYFQPELVYSMQGAKYDDGEDDGKLKMDYLNIPLLAKYQTGSGFFVETGPQIGFLLSAKEKFDDEDIDIKEYFKKTDFSWAIGLGYKMANGFGINGRYNFGLSKIGEEVDGEDPGKAHNSVIQLGVFYVFGSSK